MLPDVQSLLCCVVKFTLRFKNTSWFGIEYPRCLDSNLEHSFSGNSLTKANVYSETSPEDSGKSRRSASAVRVCMGFTALLSAMVLFARSQDPVVSASVRGYMSHQRLLDLGAEESRVLRHGKLPHCGEAFR